MRTLLLTILFLNLNLNLFSQKVVHIRIDGTINPASAQFIGESIKKAADEKAECLVIGLNTPGGLLKSTRVIVSDILESPIPVVVYVSPGGAHAGSAGVFITMAAHVAAMAPGTNIGAAHPVNAGGDMEETMKEKATNDAVAFIKSIAHKRGRNAEWAADAVRRSVAIPENEAVEKNVVDLVAPSLTALMDSIDGRVVTAGAGEAALQTAEATVENHGMSQVEKLLDLISDPNIAYILMMLGFYGLLFELYNPGAIFPGIIGGICLLLAFYAMHTLPVNYAGLGLIIFAVILFLLEIKVTSYGMLTIGGVISLLLGSLMLFRTGTPWNVDFLSRTVIFSMVGATTLFFLFVITLGLKAQRARPITGQEGMTGTIGVAMETLDPAGIVRVHGEIWQAVSVDGRIESGEKIKVVSIKGLKLEVAHSTNHKIDT